LTQDEQERDADLEDHRREAAEPRWAMAGKNLLKGPDVAPRQAHVRQTQVQAPSRDRHPPAAPPRDAGPPRQAAPPGRAPHEEDDGWDFDTFAAARWPHLVRTAYLLTGDHHEAEDLVQSTLAKVYLGWSRIRCLDAPDAYVHRALVNNNISRFRKRRVVHLLTPLLPERARAEPPTGIEDRALLMAALATLPPRQRAAVVLRYWEDLSEQQVADILGCSPGNVKSQASRGLRKLRGHPALAELAGAPAPGPAPAAVRPRGAEKGTAE
jgi:RNA polymerase sigma-70 factor (sigma-E family)